MHSFLLPSRALPCLLPVGRLNLFACTIALALAVNPYLCAQTTAPTQEESPQPAAPAAVSQPGVPAVFSESSTPSVTAPSRSQAGAISEDEIRQLLMGKSLYLRGGYLDNSLSFEEHGKLIGHSQQGSYTLNLIQIDKVRLTKRKLELQGMRYGLHFLGAEPNEDPTKAVDRVRITPKKKMVKITIDRELVVVPKKKKHKKSELNDAAESAARAHQENAAPTKAAVEAAAESAPEESPEAGNVTTTNSPAHAAQLLRDALGNVFANGLDNNMIAAMPQFWKLYYQASASHTDYRPSVPGVLRQSDVDQKAKLLTSIEPPSNEYAQNGGVAGMALYHAVIGADGKPEEIAVDRPIGFGLDENAVDVISKANFQPAIKDGKPVPVLLDLLVQFRIYSKRTAVESAEKADKPAGPILPGPYTARP
jgi:hypothetical protein